ncbi:ABC transporter ATP-binding protein [Pullulanibacillus sp. KACC 23026]|uniref:metal ABC transporter ATP-binding protein n=1 Tax=Pullulanibacillus sp. KACC 23026 TaxID=3028315 RepID=UPI0023AFA7A1|nr:ABC transporter ATP-binding protein [Pullulanibacillus sp. KACC 23026]WEG13669.1 ABC transporter ATP-binding protein [Pullulanibacillus sp. KACC 23026]
MVEAVTLKNVNVSLDGKWILRNLTFSVESGDFLGIIGPNGAGKTTLMNVLLNVLKPQEGSVDMVKASELGYVPQSRQIDPEMPLSSRNFVSLGLPHRFRPWLTREDKMKVDEAMAMTDSLDYAGKPIGKLSGGQKQRLFLAQALVKTPQLLLLDEPTSNLDPGAQETIVSVVDRIRRVRGITVLFVSHDINLISRYADQILYMTKESYAIGSVNDIMQASVLTNLYGTPVEVVHSGSNLLVSFANTKEAATSICVHSVAE